MILSLQFIDVEVALTHRSLTSPLISSSAVPSAYLFQLSAVPILMLGKVVFKSLIFANNCCPVRLPRYKASEPTVIAYTASALLGSERAVLRAALSAS